MAKKSSASNIQIEVQIAPAFSGPDHGNILSPERLTGVIRTVLQHMERTGQVTLVITDDEGIRELSRDFLEIDEPTDVLAFSAQEDSGPFVSAPEAGDYLGDVIVSFPRAKAQAEEMGHSVELEINLLVVHGLLHLLGHDHGSEEDKAIMWAEQDTILRNL
jgi:probable rRNA maturation factor